MTRYPTWQRIDNTTVISEEQMDGVPDFYIVRDKETKSWAVKWRTSACWSRGFNTAQQAMRDVESNFKGEERA